ncbi:hypothetical protein [Tunturibacter empetritectus]|uniref:hypothetical protein n=1 Tax=Tunturiibacter empetritectus TaxID=3069691 RepID=UPI0028896C36|nr:hypothetical protein [Edaphobacter lichenicola]
MVSGQQHGLVVLDEHLQVIRPAKLWNDREPATQKRGIDRPLRRPASLLRDLVCSAAF